MEWRLFADLAERAGGKRIEVDVDAGASVEEALDALLADRPELRDRVLDDDGGVRDHVNLLHNGEDADLEATVQADDELALFPPVSGG